MNFQIKNPCPENWNEMSATEGGRFCDSCKCRVHDFTNSNAEDLKRQYDLNNGKLCGHVPGRLLAQQFQQAAIRKGYFHNLKVFCWAAVLSFGASLFSIPAAHAKNVIREVRSTIFRMEKDSVKMKEIIISGTVRDNTNQELLPFANVLLTINDTTVVMACTTDLDGNYQLKIDPATFKNIGLKFTYVGYEMRVMKNILIKEDKNIYIDMALNPHTLDGLIEYVIDPEYVAPDPFTSGKTVKGKQYRKMPKQ